MKIQILTVEDNPDMVHMHQNILDHWGYGSIVAKNGKEAVDMAASQLPDLILLDIIQILSCWTSCYLIWTALRLPV